MRGAGHVARMRKNKCVQSFGGETSTKWYHLEDLGVDGRTVLNES